MAGQPSPNDVSPWDELVSAMTDAGISEVKAHQLVLNYRYWILKAVSDWVRDSGTHEGLGQFVHWLANDLDPDLGTDETHHIGLN